MKRSNDISLKDAINAFINNYGLREKYLQATIQSQWKTIMGDTIANHTNDVYIAGKALTIFLDSSALKHELNQSKDKIIHLVNEAIGERVIEHVFIR